MSDLLFSFLHLVFLSLAICLSVCHIYGHSHSPWPPEEIMDAAHRFEPRNNHVLIWSISISSQSSDQKLQCRYPSLTRVLYHTQFTPFPTNTHLCIPAHKYVVVFYSFIHLFFPNMPPRSLVIVGKPTAPTHTHTHRRLRLLTHIITHYKEAVASGLVPRSPA